MSESGIEGPKKGRNRARRCERDDGLSETSTNGFEFGVALSILLALS